MYCVVTILKRSGAYLRLFDAALPQAAALWYIKSIKFCSKIPMKNLIFQLLIFIFVWWSLESLSQSSMFFDVILHYDTNFNLQFQIIDFALTRNSQSSDFLRSAHNLKKSSTWFWRLLSKEISWFAKTMRKIFSNYVRFSKSPNFTEYMGKSSGCFLSLVLLLISNLTNELRLHQILGTCSLHYF